jgi:arabinofuranosyltransferase
MPHTGWIRAREEWLLVTGLLLFSLHVYWLNCVAEDAYITYRYARHLADGHGFVWNIGDPPVEGFTNFSWVLLSAAAYRLGADLPRLTQAIGLLAGVITLLYTHRFSRRILRLGRPASLFITFLCAAAGPLACWAGSGMETAFFGLWVVVAVFHLSRAVGSDSPADVAIAAVSLFFATLTRPEGVGVFVILAGGWLVLSWAGERRKRLRTLLLFVGIYLPLFGAYFAWRYSLFGYPLPNTFYAKTGGGPAQYRRGLVYSAYFAFHFLAPCVVWFVIPLVSRAREGLRLHLPEGWTSHLRHSCRAHAGAWLAGALALAYTAYIVAVGGDYMAMYRFFVPVIPLLYALVGIAVQQTLLSLQHIPGQRWVVCAMAAATLGGIFLHSTPVEARLFAVTPGMHGTYRGVQVERWHVNRFLVIAAFFDREKASAADSLLTYDIGVTGHVLRMRIYDVLGIVDPVIAHQPIRRTPSERSLAGHEKQDLAYSFSKAPTFFMYTVRLRPGTADWPDLAGELGEQVRREYVKKAIWLEDPANGERGYFTYLQRLR